MLNATGFEADIVGPHWFSKSCSDFAQIVPAPLAALGCRAEVYAFSNTGANAGSKLSTTPNQHDFDELGIIYAHLDSTTTVAAATMAAQAPADVDVTDDPVSWGQLVRQSANGRSSNYERYNTDSSITSTHVYWTNEAAAKYPSCDHRRDYLHR